MSNDNFPELPDLPNLPDAPTLPDMPSPDINSQEEENPDSKSSGKETGNDLFANKPQRASKHSFVGGITLPPPPSALGGGIVLPPPPSTIPEPPSLPENQNVSIRQPESPTESAQNKDFPVPPPPSENEISQNKRLFIPPPPPLPPAEGEIPQNKEFSILPPPILPKENTTNTAFPNNNDQQEPETSIPQPPKPVEAPIKIQIPKPQPQQQPQQRPQPQPQQRPQQQQQKPRSETDEIVAKYKVHGFDLSTVIDAYDFPSKFNDLYLFNQTMHAQGVKSLELFCGKSNTIDDDVCLDSLSFFLTGFIGVVEQNVSDIIDMISSRASDIAAVSSKLSTFQTEIDKIKSDATLSSLDDMRDELPEIEKPQPLPAGPEMHHSIYVFPSDLQINTTSLDKFGNISDLSDPTNLVKIGGTKPDIMVEPTDFFNRPKNAYQPNNDPFATQEIKELQFTYCPECFQCYSNSVAASKSMNSRISTMSRIGRSSLFTSFVTSKLPNNREHVNKPLKKEEPKKIHSSGSFPPIHSASIHAYDKDAKASITPGNVPPLSVEDLFKRINSTPEEMHLVPLQKVTNPINPAIDSLPHSSDKVLPTKTDDLPIAMNNFELPKEKPISMGGNDLLPPHPDDLLPSTPDDLLPSNPDDLLPPAPDDLLPPAPDDLLPPTPDDLPPPTPLPI